MTITTVETYTIEGYGYGETTPHVIGSAITAAEAEAIMGAHLSAPHSEHTVRIRAPGQSPDTRTVDCMWWRAYG